MVAVPVLLRATPLAAAVALESSGGKGLLITLREFTLPAALVATFLINDLTSYLLHRLIHAVPALWRHRIGFSPAPRIRDSSGSIASSRKPWRRRGSGATCAR